MAEDLQPFSKLSRPRSYFEISLSYSPFFFFFTIMAILFVFFSDFLLFFFLIVYFQTFNYFSGLGRFISFHIFFLKKESLFKIKKIIILNTFKYIMIEN